MRKILKRMLTRYQIHTAYHGQDNHDYNDDGDDDDYRSGGG